MFKPVTFTTFLVLFSFQISMASPEHKLDPDHKTLIELMEADGLFVDGFDLIIEKRRNKEKILMVSDSLTCKTKYKRKWQIPRPGADYLIKKAVLDCSDSKYNQKLSDARFVLSSEGYDSKDFYFYFENNLGFVKIVLESETEKCTIAKKLHVNLVPRFGDHISRQVKLFCEDKY